MLSSSSYCLSHRPLTLPSLSRIRVPNRPASLSLLNRNFRVTDSHFSSSKSRWKICCFRQEEFPAENLKPEVVEEVLAEELVKPKLEFQTVLKKDWRLGFREVDMGTGRASAGTCTRLHQGFKYFIVCSSNSLFKKEEQFVNQLAAASVLKAVGDRWNVPWTGETILQVMLLWVASFWFVGSWMMPFAAHIAGFSKESLTYRGQAFYSLLTDVTEGLAGIAILHQCLSRFRPLPPGWFKFSLKGNWHFDVALGCLMFPLVNRLSQFNLDILPLLPSTPATLSSVEQSILARDPVAMGLYVVVVSVCAPIWEEIVFRGFLLPSLTKYMPVWCSILVSSVVFALAHFNVQRMPPLIFLGIVMGALFSRTRNLVPPMLLHSLWNAFVFLDLMK